ncbi:UNVERIFIED_CONTAM: putative cell survival pathways protein [Siphonaria sp. JEL0065]|nr:putative cell survival pathways protein [Siphonaria sp. JEL0065]
MSFWGAPKEVDTKWPLKPITKLADPVNPELSVPVEIESLEASQEDVKWQLEYPAQATESFTYYLTLDNGTYVLAQMVYSTLGLSPSVQMTLRIYNADKTKFSKTVSPATSSLKVSADKQSAVCEQFTINFVPETGVYNLSFNLTEAAIDVSFKPTVPLFKVNDGKSLFGKFEVDGYVEAQFIPKAQVQGTVTFKGKKYEAKGQGQFVKAIQCKPQTLAKWNFFNLQNDKDALMLYEYDKPKGSDAPCVSIGAIVRNGQTIAVTTSNRSVHVQKQLDEDFSGYEVPTQLFLTWNGKTKETGEDVQVEISYTPTNLVDKIDVLAELPFLLRKLIQTFITAPYLYQWYENVTANVTIGKESFKIEGKAFTECSFLTKE